MSVPRPHTLHLGSFATPFVSVFLPDSSSLNSATTFDSAPPFIVQNSAFLYPIHKESEKTLWALRTSLSPSMDYPTHPMNAHVYIPTCSPEPCPVMDKWPTPLGSDRSISQTSGCSWFSDTIQWNSMPAQVSVDCQPPTRWMGVGERLASSLTNADAQMRASMSDQSDACDRSSTDLKCVLATNQKLSSFLNNCSL